MRVRRAAPGEGEGGGGRLADAEGLDGAALMAAAGSDPVKARLRANRASNSNRRKQT